MEVIFIRHSKPDYSCVNKNSPNILANLAPLCSEGINLAKKNILTEDELKDAIILSSPYTRALQTASIMSRGQIIVVENLLHEWLPSKTYSIKCSDLPKRDKMFKERILDEDIETREELIIRLDSVLNKYKNLGHKKVIIFAHSRLISTFLGIKYMDYCQKITYTY